jgi:TolB-like protein/Tfp pilus assembly protein PilF
MIYRFEAIEFDTDRYELRQGGVAQKVEPQVFALLELLIANRERLVSKDELNLRVWGGRVVSEAVVNSRIRLARRAIGDDGRAQRLIKTIHNRGFRFVGGPVQEAAVSQGYFAGRDSPVAAQPAGAELPAVEASRPSIAVLPFQMLTPDQRYEMFADAIAHEVIVELARVHWLFVIARGSSFRFRGPHVDLAAAGEVLGAGYFLTGSVAIDGGRSAVTVELSRAADSQVVWAERFDGSIDDLLGLRARIAASAITAVEVRIPIEEARRMASLPTENLDSWSAYHRGLWHMYRFNAHDNKIAAAMFARALEADRNFARAHAGLSFTHFQNAFVGYASDTNFERRRAKEHAERSMELDPLDPFANLTMGRAAMLSGDLADSASWFNRCVELSPNYAFAIYNRGLVRAIAGEGSRSEEDAARAISLSPIDPLHYAMLATRALSHIVRGDYAAASAWAERAAWAPNAHVLIRVIAALAHELAGNQPAAEAWAAAARRTGPGNEQAAFLSAFPFSNESTRTLVQRALKRLQI